MGLKDKDRKFHVAGPTLVFRLFLEFAEDGVVSVFILVVERWFRNNEDM